MTTFGGYFQYNQIKLRRYDTTMSISFEEIVQKQKLKNRINYSRNIDLH